MTPAGRWSRRVLPCGRPGVLVRSPASDTLIAVRSPHEEWPLQSTGLALKAVLEGEREFWVDGRRHLLGPGRFLLLPPGSRLESGRTSVHVAMLPIWFSPRTSESVLGTLAASGDEELLEGKARERALDVTPLPRNAALERAVRRLWRAVDSGPIPELEALLLRTLAAAARAARLGERRLERLSSVRTSTRREIVRRLSLAEDLLRARFRSPLSLTELAGAASMSPYHFLRRFGEYYGTTPHRLLTRLRLSHARGLLARGKTVKETAFDCGYRSVPSFVHLCTRAWGVTPATLSRAHQA